MVAKKLNKTIKVKTEEIVEQEKRDSSLSRLLIVLAVFFSLYLLSRYFGGLVDLDMVEESVNKAGPLAPLLYMSFYVVAPTILFPASILTMAGGVIFGPIWGTIYTIVSATIGATVPFLITRRYGRAPLEKLLSKYDNFDDQFKKFEDQVAKEGWKYVAFTRLVTLFPFLILNYAFGLTKIGLWTYVWASLIFMLPGSFMFTYMGYAGKEALGGTEDALTKVSIALGCFILISALPGAIKRIKRSEEV